MSEDGGPVGREAGGAEGAERPGAAKAGPGGPPARADAADGPCPRDAGARPREATIPILNAVGIEKSYPIRRIDVPLYARLTSFLFGWTGALEGWAALNTGLPVLKGLDLAIRDGEILTILGPSGAGKSTLLHLLGALDPPNAGRIIFRGRDLTLMSASEVDRYRNHHIGFVFQFYHLLPDLTALENVLLPGMVAFGTLAFLSAKETLSQRAEHLLESVGLADRLRHRPSQLSGGEQQRVAIARALLLDPELLLCDEPTGNLDRRTGESVLDLLWDLNAKRDRTYVIVSHDPRVAERADRSVYMEDGRIQSSPSPEPDRAGAGSKS